LEEAQASGSVQIIRFNAIIEENIFCKNSGPTSGGVLIFNRRFSDKYIIMNKNIFEKNKQTTTDYLRGAGGGAITLFNQYDSVCNITNNQFYKNKALNNGGAIAILDSYANIKCNNFICNKSDKNGAAIYINQYNINFKPPLNIEQIIKCNNYKPYNENTIFIEDPVENFSDKELKQNKDNSTDLYGNKLDEIKINHEKIMNMAKICF
jgi:hypothetical protein